MIAKFEPCRLNGKIHAPPSKSVAHRYLIAAFLSGESTVKNVALSEDILATLDSLKALGAEIKIKNGEVFIKRTDKKSDILTCRESGSTLRFLIPLALCENRKITFSGAKKLFERPLDIYEEIAQKNGFLFEKGEGKLTLSGSLKSGIYNVRGDVSSQFITGLLFALSVVDGDSVINITPPFESRSYVLITLKVMSEFGVTAELSGNTIKIKGAQKYFPKSAVVEGDYSNAAYIDAFNTAGSNIQMSGLSETLQGDAVYKKYFAKLNEFAELDLSDCPDLAPILFCIAAIKKGALFTGTKRLAMKESDRGKAMQEELAKFGVSVNISENEISVKPTDISRPEKTLNSHNDHRIVMALSFLLTLTGGEISGADAVKKSFPDYFDKIKSLGAKVELTNK